jgi:DNA-binding response OmpR family regulator
MTGCERIHRPENTRRALLLQAEPGVMQLVVRTLERGGFVVRVARTLAEAQAILAGWRPDLAIVDMDHADGPALLLRLGASTSLHWRSGTPILGLTRRADLPARLRAFGLGVDDILAVPFAPQELLARAIVVGRPAPSPEVWLAPPARKAAIEVDTAARGVRGRNEHRPTDRRARQPRTERRPE